jgi:hypothetical protein
VEQDVAAETVATRIASPSLTGRTNASLLYTGALWPLERRTPLQSQESTCPLTKGVLCSERRQVHRSHQNHLRPLCPS